MSHVVRSDVLVTAVRTENDSEDGSERASPRPTRKHAIRQ
jgi:hypothetical protein